MLHFLLFPLADVPLPREQPFGGNPVIVHKVCEPCGLEDVPCHILFECVHVPAVDSVFCGEGLLPPYHPLGFEVVQRLEEAAYYFLTVLCLHSLSDLAVAFANLAFISFVWRFARISHERSVAGLKSGFVQLVIACLYSLNSAGDI